MTAKRSPGNRLDTPDAEIVAAYVAGESELAISKRFGLWRIVIRQRLVEAGVHIRNRSEANLLRASRMSAQERRDQAAAAHAAIRGRKTPLEERCRRAQTRQEQGIGISAVETVLTDWLRDRGIAVHPQLAIGPYNVDIGIPPVAVEVFGGTWHASRKHSALAAKRFPYIANRGWAPLIVWVHARAAPLLPEAADYIAAFVELARRDEAVRGEYRVIWGSGEEIASGKSKNHDFSVVAPSRHTLNRRPRDKN